MRRQAKINKEGCCFLSAFALISPPIEEGQSLARSIRFGQLVASGAFYLQSDDVKCSGRRFFGPYFFAGIQEFAHRSTC
jgi:hypothetical protein